LSRYSLSDLSAQEELARALAREHSRKRVRDEQERKGKRESKSED